MIKNTLFSYPSTIKTGSWIWNCKNAYYQDILCEHAPSHSLLLAFTGIFRAVNSPVTGFPPPLSDTPQHWLQPLISNQAWACVSCSTIYSQPANRHKSTSKICLRTISLKEAFAKFQRLGKGSIQIQQNPSVRERTKVRLQYKVVKGSVVPWRRRRKDLNPSVKARFCCERLHWCGQELVRAQTAVKNHMSLSIRRKDDIILQVVNMSRTSQVSHIITLLNRRLEFDWG